MKIIDNRNNTIFGELNPGDTFMFPCDERVFMKTTETDSNCVNLTNGQTIHTSEDIFIIVVHATLTLE